MPYSSAKNEPPRERTRINLSSPPDVQHWVEELEVDEESLREAVEAVGDRVADVRSYIASQAEKRRGRPKTKVRQ
jgi:hypothetical protein